MTNLIKWSPFFNQFEELEKMMNGYMPLMKKTGNSFMPAIDMYEDEKNVIVETELSGIDPEKINISIENDTLCIKGEGEKKSEVDDKNYYRKEIKRGSFYRSIPLPTRVLGDDAEAEAVDGVLKITIPKTTESKAKSIKIKTKNKLK